MKKICTSF